MSKLPQDGTPFTVEVRIPTDENGLTGRECPVQTCLGYFKIKGGTGLKGEKLPCYCPYCGHRGSQNTFWTREQIAFAKSIAVRHVAKRFVEELETTLSRGPVKFKRGSPVPIRHYREKQLETAVICSRCTLEYAIYGVFGYCPDCGVHNSLQILRKNIELFRKQLRLAESSDDAALKEHLIGDVLENAVSAFDGFGREIVAVQKAFAADPEKAASVSFQALEGAAKKINDLFGFQLSDGVPSDEWALLVRCFQKRHLLSHKMGVIDEKYTSKTHDPSASVGRKVVIEPTEVTALLNAVEKMGDHVNRSLAELARRSAMATQKNKPTATGA